MARIGAISSTGRRVLVVDDMAELAQTTCRWLSRRGYETRATTHADEVISLVGTWAPHVIVLDVWMGGTDGRALAAEVRAQWPDVRVVMTSASDVEIGVDLDGCRFHRKMDGPHCLAELIGELFATSGHHA